MRIGAFVGIALVLSAWITALGQEIGSLEPGGYLLSSELLKALENEVSGEIAKTHVEEISRYHRIRGGGPGYHASALYIQRVLEVAGILDDEMRHGLLLAPGSGGAVAQDFK